MVTMVKNINILLFCVVVLSSALHTSPVQAQAAWSWMTESAISKFTSEDIGLLKNAGRDALNNQPDQSEVPWNNPDTGNSGSITVTNTRQVDDRTCRNALLKNNAENIKGTLRLVLCQQTDGTWIVSAPSE
jgi:surface antigen